jgi:ribosomal-protein-alanine N-acetyltransferase
MKTLETNRLNLRLFTAADFDLLHSLHANPEVAKSTIDGMQTRDQVRQHLNSFISHQEKFGYSQFAVFEKASGKFIGRAGITNRTLSPTIGPQNEVRFAFLPDFWGKGYASEVTEFLLKFAFETLKLDVVSAANGPKNAPSHRVLIKNGFKFIKNLVSEGYGSDGEIRYYLITHQEFLNKK